MANGTPNGPNPLPGWLAPLATLITQVGVPTVFSLVLLWFVLTRLDAILQVVESQELARTTVVQQIGKDFIVALDGQAARFEAAIQANIVANREMMDRYHRERNAGQP